MKHLLLLITLLLLSATASAQTSSDSQHARSADPLYLQLYGGVNKSANEHLPWTEMSAYPWAGGLFVAVGREWKPLWGWRAALRYNRNKGRNVPECEQRATWSWNNLGLFADATFDLTDALHCKPRTAPARFNLKLFAGLGAAYTFNLPQGEVLSYIYPYTTASSVQAGLRAGFTAQWRLSHRWRLGMELSHTFFTDGFNGVKGGCGVDTRTNLKAGVAYVFAPKVRKERYTTVVYAHRLQHMPALPMAMPQAEKSKHRRISGRAFLDFPVNETDIYADYRRNPVELARIHRTIDSALFDTTMRVTCITLHGYASPESPYDNNVRLARGRTASLMQHLQRAYRLPATLFRTSFTAEDWQNLRAFIADGNRRRVKDDLWYETADVLETPAAPEGVTRYRDELLRIIDSADDPDAREERLKQVGGGEPYRWLLQHVYPGLRHTDYTIDYEVQPYPVAQARRLIYTHPEALSLEEMYRVAQSYPEASDGWLDALLTAARLHPTHEQALINAACGCMQVRRFVDARRYLARCADSDTVRYLYDVLLAAEGKAEWELRDGRVVILPARR